jgi:hypothetical protein
MTNAKLKALLKAHGACAEAVKWLGQKDAATAWQSCPNAQWMLWLARRVGISRQQLVIAACACARTSLKYVPEGELRPLQAIETAEAWCGGRATLDDVRSAAYAADYAAADAATHAATHAADAAYAAAYAAYAAGAATYAATYAAAKRQCADLVRQHITIDGMLAAITNANAGEEEK